MKKCVEYNRFKPIGYVGGRNIYPYCNQWIPMSLAVVGSVNIQIIMNKNFCDYGNSKILM